jgi:hypothetical protein
MTFFPFLQQNKLFLVSKENKLWLSKPSKGSLSHEQITFATDKKGLLE